MKRSVCVLTIASLIVGCMTSNTGIPSVSEQGLVELRIDVTQFLVNDITHVTVETGGEPQDLLLNPTTGTFDGSMFLSPGTKSLVARVFSNETLVGQSAPTTVDVVSGVATRVMMRILDVTSSPPQVYGPRGDDLV
jgi:hypothetical protein